MKTRISILTLALLASISSVFADVVILSFNADGHNILTYEAQTGRSYRLDTILSNRGISVTGCRGYNFIGWKQGSPVAADEDPTSSIVTSVAPTKNINFYAVYQKTGAAANRFTRITSTKDLRAGDQYVLTCFYEWDGDVYYGPSYFALGNTNQLNASYWNTGIKDTIDNYTRSGRRPNYTYTYDQSYVVDWYLYGMWTISADQVYPSAGAIDNPANTNIWTLGGSEDAWTFTNVANTNRRLNISRNYDQIGYEQTWNGYDANHNPTTAGWKVVYNLNEQLLTNPGNTFAISAANGEFNFRADNGYCLTYSDDDDDYFQTGKSNSWTFYLYKKESQYTSYPNCEDWTLHLDAADGFVGTSANHTVDSVESTPGAGIILPAASRPSGDCADWTFAGWVAESPIKGQRSPQYGKTNAPSLITAGSVYHPKYNGETLYAVFQKTEAGVVYYERITNRSEITNGGVYVLATTSNRAITNTIISSYYFYAEDISVAGNEISSAVGQNIQWTYNGTKFYNGSIYLSYGGGAGTNEYYAVPNTNTTSPFQLRNNRYNSYYLVTYTYGSDYVIGEYQNEYDQFYIYKRKTRSVTTYTSFPHCTRYTITLHGCGGKIAGDGEKYDRDITESSAGSGFDLPIVVPDCQGRGWSFVGWLEGGDLASVEEAEFTGLHNGHYVPSRDGVNLFAVYKRKIEKFRIISYPNNMVVGDNYVITYYTGAYDYEISAEPYNATTLSAAVAESPQDGSSWYIIARDSAVLWQLGGSENAWTFYNDSVGKYLNINTGSGALTTNATATEFTVTRSASALNLSIQGNTSGRYLYYDGTKFSASSSANEQCFLYRQMKEFTSWPHCDPFTVYFDAGNGTSGTSSLTEEYAYADIVLPNAYVNSDCSKEGWTFAGWAKAPITDESDALTVDLYPAGSHYSLTSNNSTLYAVYYIREDTYKKISSTDELKMGVNYIITSGTGNKALSNTPYNSNYIAAVTVSPSGNVITNTDETLDWRLQGKAGEHELYNHANEVFLDLSSHDGDDYARLTPADGGAYDNFLITMVGEKVVVRSNKNYLGSNEGVKYLGYSGTYFHLVDYATAGSAGLYFYQQEAVYHTYPSCIEDVDAIHWTITPEGGFVTVESYVLTEQPNMAGAIGYPTFNDGDGTFTFKYNPTDPELAPCTPQAVTWDGKTTILKIPYIANEDMTSATLFGGDDCSSCDVVVMTGNTLTISENRTVHTLTVQDGATLNVSNDVTLTVNSLVLDANGDQSAPAVNLNNSGSIILKNDELYYDLRIPEDRFYWLALPFNSQLQEISYSNVAANGGTPPVYNTNFAMYYYDGAHRAADANAGVQNYPYWTPVAATGQDYTMKYGQGYLFGMANQAHINYNGQTLNGQAYTHAKRVYRFTMRPPVATWLPQERNGGYKVSDVVASAVSNPRNDVHAGWNLIGNPYMHEYQTGTVSGLRNGAWKKEIVDGVWTRFWILDNERPVDVPYITFFDPATSTYSQDLASGETIRPFQAVFVQINAGSGLKFESNMNVRAMPAYMRFMEEEQPARTGITLSGNGQSDHTGVVLYEDYTKAYEIGADLQKMLNDKRVNLYTIDTARNELAFIALSDEDAADSIPVGIQLPAPGTYTFAFDAERYNITSVDTLQLIDTEEQTTTDLLHSNYEFTASEGTNNHRFFLVLRRAKEEAQIPTDITNNDTYNAGAPHKIIRDGQLFIICDDKMYNAVGTQVK